MLASRSGLGGRKKGLTGQENRRRYAYCQKAKADAAATAEQQENKRLTVKRLAAAAEKIAKAVDDAVDYAAELVAKQKRAADAFENIQKELATL
ncbi:hypothetical protein DL768_000188 [Monosporascus sp. mg162]|nr:hypothetical protein DL768_000188 [Monosporascus sp. mg162]